MEDNNPFVLKEIDQPFWVAVPFVSPIACAQGAGAPVAVINIIILSAVKWIDLVFISKKTDNIHYFDASFANTCLELEMIFKVNEKKINDEDILEFF